MYIKAGDEIQLQRIDGVWKQIGCVGEENRLLAHWTEMERPFENTFQSRSVRCLFPPLRFGPAGGGPVAGKK